MATINQISKEERSPIIKFIDRQDLKKGDLLVLDFEDTRKIVTVEQVKVSIADGVEVIYDLKKNHYFNLTMYRDEKSNVLNIHRIEL